jgi:hypothetical protein
MVRYAYSGCVAPLPHPRKRKGGSQVCRSDAVVGNHFSVGCWGPRSQEDAPSRPAAVGGRLARTALARYRSEWLGGACVRGEKAPAPKSEGPLLPARTPTPRNTAVAATGGLDARPCRARFQEGSKRAGGSPGTLAGARVRHQPRRYAYSGCVARCPTPQQRKGSAGLSLGCRRRVPLQRRVLGAAVSGGCPTQPSRRGARLAIKAVARYRSDRLGGAGVRGEKAPAPNSEGPLLPSRTPTPRNTAVAATGGLDARPCRAQMRGRLRGNRRCARNPRACSGSAPA